MLGRSPTQILCNLFRRHRAITNEVLRIGLLDLIDDRAGNFFGDRVKFLFYRIGSVVPRTPFNGVDFSPWYQRQQVSRFETYILHAQMTRHLVGHLAQRLLEIRL